MVNYDALVESIALIEAGHPGPAQQWCDDENYVPLAVDVLDDVAVTAFARRRAERLWHDVHVLTRRGTSWTVLGGGTSNADDDLLAESPVVLPPYATGVCGLSGSDPDGGGGVLGVATAGGTHDDRGGPDRWPWSGRWISWAEVRVTRQVNSLQVHSARGIQRRVAPPWHGRVMVIWTGCRSPQVRALDGTGGTLGELRLPR